MDFIPRDKILKFRPDTLQVCRDEINLGKPGEMKEAVKILKAWVQQQPHFKKKDFTDHYLETTILGSKGSIERAKKQIDKVCTLRTLWPHYFAVKDIRKEFADIFDAGSFAVMPDVNEQNHRVFIARVHGKIRNATQFFKFYKYGFCIGEYMRAHDYIGNYHYIVDLREANMTDLLAVCNPLELNKALMVLIECYGIRIKGLYFITTSKLIDVFFSILKQVLKPKIIQRLHHHNTCDDLVKLIGKTNLPVELGGTAPSIRDIHNQWVEVLSSNENMEYLRGMNEAMTDEALRPRIEYNEEYAGLSGSFRFLSVD